jgi:hypothetical protein
MNPLMVAAQFAAFLWFTGRRDSLGKPVEEARRFARENWELFLPVAHEGVGRLLLRIARVRPTRDRLPHLAPVTCGPQPAGPAVPPCAADLPFSRN